MRFRFNNNYYKKRTHSLKRLFNLFLARIGLIFRPSNAWGYPTCLVIESTNICNLKCPLCPTGQRIPGRARGKMSFTNFKKIIDELGSYLYSLRLENWGEPLLNEEIYSMISYAKSRKICVSFNTNLHFLDEKKAQGLILSGLDHLKVSLDGATSESYAKYRVGGDFDEVINNIELLVKQRDRMKKKNPFIEIQFIAMKHNEHEVEEIKRLSKTLGVDALFIEKLRPDMREELFSSDIRSIEKFKDWLPSNSALSIFDYNNKKRKPNKKICSYLWTTSVINWDGSVVPCCSVYDEKYDFGNVFSDGFKNVWNGSKYRAARRLIGRSFKIDTPIICINCAKFGIKA